ncbi:MAG: hypothetical protein AAGB22_03035 [Bacteroidota bacterium]
MKKAVFRMLARINRALLPSYIYRDLTRLSTWDKLLIAYRYWVTIRAL